MDVILEFLVEFVATVLAELIGDLLGPLFLLLAIGAGAYEFWPFGVAPHVAVGGLIVAMSLIGAGLIMRRSAQSRRKAMSCPHLNDQAGHPDQRSCRQHRASPTPSSTASPAD